MALSTLSWPLVLLLSAFLSFHGLKPLPGVAPPLSGPPQHRPWGQPRTPVTCDACVTDAQDGQRGSCGLKCSFPEKRKEEEGVGCVKLLTYPKPLALASFWLESEVFSTNSSSGGWNGHALSVVALFRQGGMLEPGGLPVEPI